MAKKPTMKTFKEWEKQVKKDSESMTKEQYMQKANIKANEKFKTGSQLLSQFNKASTSVNPTIDRQFGYGKYSTPKYGVRNQSGESYPIYKDTRRVIPGSDKSSLPKLEMPKPLDDKLYKKYGGTSAADDWGIKDTTDIKITRPTATKTDSFINEMKEIQKLLPKNNWNWEKARKEYQGKGTGSDPEKGKIGSSLKRLTDLFKKKQIDSGTDITSTPNTLQRHTPTPTPPPNQPPISGVGDIRRDVNNPTGAIISGRNESLISKVGSSVRDLADSAVTGVANVLARPISRLAEKAIYGDDPTREDIARYDHESQARRLGYKPEFYEPTFVQRGVQGISETVGRMGLATMLTPLVGPMGAWGIAGALDEYGRGGTLKETAVSGASSAAFIKLVGLTGNVLNKGGDKLIKAIGPKAGKLLTANIIKNLATEFFAGTGADIGVQQIERPGEMPDMVRAVTTGFSNMIIRGGVNTYAQIKDFRSQPQLFDRIINRGLTKDLKGEAKAIATKMEKHGFIADGKNQDGTLVFTNRSTGEKFFAITNKNLNNSYKTVKGLLEPITATKDGVQPLRGEYRLYKVDNGKLQALISPNEVTRKQSLMEDIVKKEATGETPSYKGKGFLDKQTDKVGWTKQDEAILRLKGYDKLKSEALNKLKATTTKEGSKLKVKTLKELETQKAKIDRQPTSSIKPKEVEMPFQSKVKSLLGRAKQKTIVQPKELLKNKIKDLKARKQLKIDDAKYEKAVDEMLSRPTQQGVGVKLIKPIPTRIPVINPTMTQAEKDNAIKDARYIQSVLDMTEGFVEGTPSKIFDVMKQGEVNTSDLLTLHDKYVEVTGDNTISKDFMSNMRKEIIKVQTGKSTWEEAEKALTENLFDETMKNVISDIDTQIKANEKQEDIKPTVADNTTVQPEDIDIKRQKYNEESAVSVYAQEILTGIGVKSDHPSYETALEEYKKTGVEFINDIKEKNFKKLLDRVTNSDNKASHNLFTNLTGYKGPMKKVSDRREAVRSLDPEGFDKYIAETEEKERIKKQERIQEEKRQKEKDKQEAREEISSSKPTKDKRDFKIGDNVKFEDRKGEPLTGIITTINDFSDINPNLGIMAEVKVAQASTMGGIPITRIENVPIGNLEYIGKDKQTEVKENVVDEGLEGDSGTKSEGQTSEDVRKPKKERDTKEVSGQTGKSSMGEKDADSRATDKEPTTRNGENEPDTTSKTEGNDSTGVRNTSSGTGGPSERGGTERAGTTKKDRPSKDKSAEKTIIDNNYRITEDDVLHEGGKKTRFKNNISAIKLLKELEADGRLPTTEEKKILIKYVGWGGISEAFATKYDYSNRKEVPSIPEWEKEFNQLKELLTDEEYKSARGSTTNAHFTSKKVIDSMYDILERLGFNGGRILEPSAGTGNFLGLLPDKFRKSKSMSMAIEKDSITGRILKQLYPSSDVRVAGFEDVTIPDNYFDVAVGNVPFGNYPIYDKQYPDIVTGSIHNYFFAKSIDKVREGGIVMFITSADAMNAPGNVDFRKYVSTRADLIGATLLPSDTFKENADTQVTTALLILKKKKTGAFSKGEDWVKATRLDGNSSLSNDSVIGLNINEYFINNPDMILGELSSDKLYGSRIAVSPTGKSLDDIIKLLPENIYSKSTRPVVEDITPEVEAAELERVKDNSFFIKDGVLMQKTGKKAEKISDSTLYKLTDIKETAKKLLAAQLKDVSAEEKEKLRKQLNSKYDTFVKKHKNINSKSNISKIRPDPERYILESLEQYNDKEDSYSKSSIFEKDVIKKYTPVTSADNSFDALSISLYEEGQVNLDRMMELTGLSEDDIKKELKGRIYHDPIDGWVTDDEYLSGNVVAKLNQAIMSAEYDKNYLDNVEALKTVQPEKALYDRGDINISLGSTFIPNEVYEDFIMDIFNFGPNTRNRPKVRKLVTGSWLVDKGVVVNVEVTQTYGVPGLSQYTGFHLLEKKMNNANVLIKYRDNEDKEQVDERRTADALEKMRVLDEKFVQYVENNQKAKELIEESYNTTINVMAPRNYKVDYNKKYPGLSSNIKLYNHQMESVERVIYGGNTLLAHDVGFGKTYILVVSAMELKRVGIAKKPMMLVKNNQVSAFNKAFKELYPSAKILSLSEDDFNKGRVTQAINNIAMNDWDCVIVRQNDFKNIPVSVETESMYIEQQLLELREAMLAAASDRNVVKRLQKAEERLQARLEEIMDSRRELNTVEFEKLGIDYLFVDEAHSYKNLRVSTSLSVKGISTSKSDIAEDFFMKSQYITQLHGGKRGLVFATGTPVSNQLNELHTIFKYLRPDILRSMGHYPFDAWINAFGDIFSEIEVTATGQFKNVDRFRRFVNTKELIRLYREFADIRMDAEVLNLKLPELETGKPITVKCKAHPKFDEFVREMIRRAGNMRGRPVKGGDNMLVLLADAKRATTDMRLYSDKYDDWEFSKLNMCARQTYEKYIEMNDYKGTQQIFLEFGTRSIDIITDVVAGTTKKKVVFDANLELVRKLVELGIPRNEIALANNYSGNEQLNELFNKVNSGEIRVLIGTYGKMGTGFNIQQRLGAQHEIDIPYRPSDITQAEGRMIRQGNIHYAKDKKVAIYRYVVPAPGSTDGMMWQIIETKLRAMNDVLEGRINSIDADGEAIMTAQELKAIALADPLQKEKAELEKKFRNLNNLSISHATNLATSKSVKLRIENELPRFDEAIAEIDKLSKFLEENPKEPFSITIKDKVFTDKEKAGKFLQKQAEHTSKDEKTKIGEYRGFDLLIEKYLHTIYVSGKSKDIYLDILVSHDIRTNSMEVNMRYSDYTRVDELKTGTGVIDRLDKLLENKVKFKSSIERDKKEMEKALETLKETPQEFKYKDEHEKVRRRLKEIEREMQRREREGFSTEDVPDSLEEVTKELEKESDEDILPDDDTKFLGAGPFIRPTKQRDIKKKKRKKPLGNFEFSDEETQERWDQSKRDANSQLNRMKSFLEENMDEMKKSMFRGKFKELESGSYYADLRMKLLTFDKSKDKAMYNTLKIIQGIVTKLNPESYELFEKKVILEDIAEDAKLGIKLAFGFTPESVTYDLERLNEAIAESDYSEEINNAIAKRNKLWDSLKTEYIGAMKDVGFNISDRFKRENYFRHLMAQYLEEDRYGIIKGTGKRLKTPTHASHLRVRKGTEEFLNDYLRAEAQVIAQMHEDISKAKLIKWLENSKYNKMKVLKDKAKKMNELAINNIIETEKRDKNAPKDRKGRPISETEKRIKYFKQNIAIGFEYLSAEATSGELWDGDNGEFKDMVDYLKNKDSGIEDSDLFFVYLTQLLEKTKNMNAATILKYTALRKDYIRKKLGSNYKTWEKVMPKEYSSFQPREGNAMYMAYTIPEQVAEQLLNKVVEEVGLTEGMITKQLVLGTKYRAMVFDNNIVNTLTNLKPILHGKMAAFWRKGVNFWKQIQTTGPYRFFKFNVRNFTGDLDHVLFAMPGAVRYVSTATKELFDVMYRNASMTTNLRDWFERGGLSSVLQVNELGDINKLKMFVNTGSAVRGGIANMPVKAVNNLWKNIRLSTDFREAILRYATYLYSINDINKNGSPTKFGGAYRPDVLGLSDRRDQAYWISNNTLGAYDDVSVFGKMLADNLIPFWRFQETNMKFYKRAVQNVLNDNGKMAALGRLTLGKAIRLPFWIAVNIGKAIFFLMALTVALDVYNKTVHPDEEEALPAWVKERPHLVLPRDKDGNLRYMTRLGALSDVFEWAGLGVPYNDIMDVLNGKVSLDKKINDMAKAPVNKLVNSILPIHKNIFEAIIGVTTFPDVFNPMAIRNRKEYMARSVGLENEYRAISGLPSRGYVNALNNIFVYQADPMESAYNEIIAAKYKFIESKGKKSNRLLGYDDKSNALYYYKLAVRYKDRESANRYLDLYKEKGGTKKGMTQSIRNMRVSHGISDMKAEFLKSLDAEQKVKFEMAIKFYNEVLAKGLEVE